MDKSAPWTVLQGTLAISAISATTTGFLGILRGQEHYGFLAGTAAVNSGITAAAFFSLREYVVSPLLVHTMPFEQYQRRRHELGIGHEPTGTENTTPLSNATLEFSSMRSRKLLDSALSGSVAGALLRTLKSGPRAAVSGAITVGTVCTLLQLGYNEVGIQRLKFISQSQNPEGVSQPAVIPQAKVGANASEDVEESSSWKEKVLSIMGVRKISEEEYLKRLKLQRKHHLMRIQQLEEKLEEERKTKGERQ